MTLGWPWSIFAKVNFGHLCFNTGKVKGFSTGQVEAKLHMEPPWDRWTEVYLNRPGRMTKMAAMPIYGKENKTFKYILLWNQWDDCHET